MTEYQLERNCFIDFIHVNIHFFISFFVKKLSIEH